MAKPKLLLRQNLITVARASAGSNMFRKLYFKIGEPDMRHGRKGAVDILFDGDLSCAFYVSSVLKIFDLIPEIHTTVAGTVKAMRGAGWRPVSKPKPGAVIVWGPKYFAKNGEMHRHIGIYVGNGKAANNISKKKSPGITKWNFRPVEKIYCHSKLSFETEIKNKHHGMMPILLKTDAARRRRNFLQQPKR